MTVVVVVEGEEFTTVTFDSRQRIRETVFELVRSNYFFVLEAHVPFVNRGESFVS